jgi:COMPASS component SWD2
LLIAVVAVVVKMDMDIDDAPIDIQSSSYPVGNYDIGAVIEGEGSVNNLDFHRDGKFLVMTTTQSSIHLIDCLSGEEKKKIHCKTTGISRMKYTNHESSILMSTEKKPHTIKYLSLYDNRYIRNFAGHSDTICSLSMSSVDDVFLSASVDKTIRRWDLTSPKETARIQLPSAFESPYVSCDSSGVIFGVLAYNAKKSFHTLRLYDMRAYDSGPFQDICPLDSAFSQVLSSEYPQMAEDAKLKTNPTWTSFEFCRDGGHILINTDAEHMWMIDSFRADVPPIVLAPRKNEAGLALGCCFSGDAKTIYTGNEDNDVLLFDKQTAKIKGVLTGHVSPVGSIAANPKYDMFASACANTVLWIPKENQ